jgi:nicotinate-nucleotide adenylyltransferase
MKHIVLYGGTFDPPHYGHLNTARAVQQHVSLDRFIFLPCKDPVLKKTARASSQHRQAMLQLALHDLTGFEMDSREIMRNTPSFMVDTLESFRDEFGEETALSLCLGMDAFQQLPHWKSWQKILNLSHLIIMQRATCNEQTLLTPLKELLLVHRIHDPHDLRTKSSGHIYCLDAGHYSISSSQIRQKIQTGESIKEDVPSQVDAYIKAQALYLSCPNASN